MQTKFKGGTLTDNPVRFWHCSVQPTKIGACASHTELKTVSIHITFISTLSSASSDERTLRSPTPSAEAKSSLAVSTIKTAKLLMQPFCVTVYS